MAHEPGAGSRPVYAAGLRSRSLDGTVRSSRFFSRFAPRPRQRPIRGPSPAGIFAAPGGLRPALTNRCRRNAPEKESLGAARATSSRPLPGATIRAELRRAVGESTYEIWLAPLEVKAFETARAPARTRRRPRELGRQALRADPRALRAGGRSAPTCSVARRRRRPHAAGSEPRRPTALDRADRHASTPATASTSSSSATATASPTPPRSRSPSCPGQAYNPLFLHAPPGLGKTHLLHAIGNYVIAFGGGAIVRYTTVEAFTNHFITRARVAIARRASSTPTATSTCC